MSSAPSYVAPYLDQLNPGEVHNVGGDCINPKCNYEFNQQDKKEISDYDGQFTCPKCDKSYNYYYAETPGERGYTRSGLTPTAMGTIGENIIAEMQFVPHVGTVTWQSPDYNSPLDFIIGNYGVEVKTNHSEATPRFKMGGKVERQQKIDTAQQLGVTPAIIGVRLNFYTNQADLFFRPQLTDTWIGNQEMQHVAKVNFKDLNPFKDPSEVPSPNALPDDSDPDSDIPF